MALTLRLTIGGLVILVPDPDAGCVHVIAPRTEHFMPTMGVHESRILADTRHKLEPIDVSDHFWDLSEIASDAGRAPDVPSDVLDLRDTTTEAELLLPHEYVEHKKLKHRVALHVKLSGGRFEPVLGVRDFEICPGGPVRSLLPIIQWVATVDADELPAMKLEHLGLGLSKKVGAIPKLDTDDVHLGVLNAVLDDAPGHGVSLEKLETPAYGIDSMHFDAFFEPWKYGVAHCRPNPILSTVRSEQQRGVESEMNPIYPRICETVQVQLAAADVR